MVNYGNGVSIDTDDVIYIENGSNYHTYTFNVIRENAPADAPVENLILSPLPDGSYKELLITYTITPHEKQQIMDGETVDTRGKTTITDIAKGAFAQVLKGGLQSCSWEDKAVWEGCSQKKSNGTSVHNETNMGSWGDCTADTPPRMYTVAVFICTSIYDDNGPGGGSTLPIPSDGGTGGGNPCPECPTAGNTPNTPPDCMEIPTNPLEPTLGTGENECNTGIPTQINLPDRNTPCEKIKAQRNDEAFKKRMDTLQGKTGLKKETGYIQKWGGSYEYKDNAGATEDANTLSLPNVANHQYIKAYIHTHVDDIPNSDKKGIKMFSPADVVYFMDLIQNAQINGHSLSDVYAAMVTSTGNYQIRFTGNKFQIKTFTDQDNDYHNDLFGKAMKYSMDTSKKLELGFLKYIQEKMLLYGITLYRMDVDGKTTEIKLNADKTDTAENTCP